jgi:protein-S-isoprenylcysteine O-methyltransferase Ste14
LSTKQTTATRRGVARWLYKQAVFLALLAVMLFWLAGRWDWWQGWLQVGLYVVVVAAQALILIPRSPGLIAERSGYQKGSQVLDTVVASLAAALFPMAAWVVAGLDARYGWSPPVATLWTAAAAVVWLLGYALTIWAMAANAFFGATVRIQEERGHHVESGGPYRYVRHPGYVGAILFQLATPWLLGSWWALLPSALSAVCYVVRTALEDRTLQRELDGYREYTRQTRYRLLPGIW